MIYYDHAIFKCPNCTNKIEVRNIKGQGFGDRLERPTPFICPFCGAKVIFSKKSGRIFQLGIIIAFFISPAMLFLSATSGYMMLVLTIGLVILSCGMLTQKLVLFNENDYK